MFVPKDSINNITTLLQISDFEVRIFGLFYDAILLIDDMANISQLLQHYCEVFAILFGGR